MFTAMFAVARSVGWISQWMEMMSEETIKIGRPRQLYVGEKVKEYIPVDQRSKNGFFVNVKEKESSSRVPENTGKIGDVLASIKLS
jgi:Citrate synthase, C-terminal domain